MELKVAWVWGVVCSGRKGIKAALVKRFPDEFDRGMRAMKRHRAEG